MRRLCGSKTPESWAGKSTKAPTRGLAHHHGHPHPTLRRAHPHPPCSPSQRRSCHPARHIVLPPGPPLRANPCPGCWHVDSGPGELRGRPVSSGRSLRNLVCSPGSGKLNYLPPPKRPGSFPSLSSCSCCFLLPPRPTATFFLLPSLLTPSKVLTRPLRFQGIGLTSPYCPHRFLACISALYVSTLSYCGRSSRTGSLSQSYSFPENHGQEGGMQARCGCRERKNKNKSKI